MSKKSRHASNETSNETNEEKMKSEVNGQTADADIEKEKDCLNAGCAENGVEEENGKSEHIPTVEEKLAESESRIAQLIDQNLRQMADFDNYRKHTLKDKADLIKNASADILTKILPVIDDLERAIANNDKIDDINAIKEGTRLIYSKLMHILEGEGLKKIPAVGEKFDTDVHEAIAIIPAADEDAKNTVIDCTRDGYKLNDKVIRIAQVVVAN